MMLDLETVDAWVRGYVKAWESNDPADIGAIFAEDALYYTAPWREPWRTRKGIVEGWLGRKDTPGTWSFEYTVEAREGGLAVVSGVARYDAPEPDYVNLWLIHLNSDGLSRKFVEYWMEIH